MIESNVFDLWADDYDNEVKQADENNEYPFAGYRIIMNTLYNTIMKRQPATVLDIGIGTGTLARKLYEGGNTITGVDFSGEMLAKAKAKMPNATFHQCDFAQGLPATMANTKYDFIVSTYALHHLTDPLKVTFIKSLLQYLNDDGVILIGDIGFPTRYEFDECKKQHTPDDWDDDEYYFVFEEMSKELDGHCLVSYEQVSHCAGIMEIRLQSTGNNDD